MQAPAQLMQKRGTGWFMGIFLYGLTERYVTRFNSLVAANVVVHLLLTAYTYIYVYASPSYVLVPYNRSSWQNYKAFDT
jgi:hypothetical protein